MVDRVGVHDRRDARRRSTGTPRRAARAGRARAPGSVSGPVARITRSRVGDPLDHAAHHADPGVRLDRLGDAPREGDAVDRQGLAGRHRGLVGRRDHQRAEAPHLLLEQADGVAEAARAQRVAAHELREVGRGVRRREALAASSRGARRRARGARPARRPRSPRARPHYDDLTDACPGRCEARAAPTCSLGAERAIIAHAFRAATRRGTVRRAPRGSGRRARARAARARAPAARARAAARARRGARERARARRGSQRPAGSSRAGAGGPRAALAQRREPQTARRSRRARPPARARRARRRAAADSSRRRSARPIGPGTANTSMPCVGRVARRHQRAAALARLDHHQRLGEPADQPVAQREVRGRGGVPGGNSVTSAPCARSGSASRAVRGRIHAIRSAGLHRDGAPAGLERALVRGRVDAAREARDHHQPGARERGGEVAREREPVAGSPRARPRSRPRAPRAPADRRAPRSSGGGIRVAREARRIRARAESGSPTRAARGAASRAPLELAGRAAAEPRSRAARARDRRARAAARPRDRAGSASARWSASQGRSARASRGSRAGSSSPGADKAGAPRDRGAPRIARAGAALARLLAGDAPRKRSPSSSSVSVCMTKRDAVIGSAAPRAASRSRGPAPRTFSSRAASLAWNDSRYTSSGLPTSRPSSVPRFR